MKKGSENRMPKKYRIPIIITVSVACIFSILATAFTYAIFTNSLHAQRTIAAYDTAGDKFSSNYLLKGYSGENGDPRTWICSEVIEVTATAVGSVFMNECRKTGL